MPNNKKYRPLLIILSIIIIFIGAIIYAKYSPASSPMILFYSTSCIHCQNVASYIEANGVRDKLKFQELEVSANPANSQLLAKKAQECKIDTSQGINVPFFFDGEKCLIGDQDIINYFQTK